MVTLFFWPLMIASIICSVLGILNKSHRSLYVSALLIIPMSIYLMGWPSIQIWGTIFPLLYVGSAILIKKKKYIMSLIVSAPVYCVIGWLGYVVLNQ